MKFVVPNLPSEISEKFKIRKALSCLNCIAYSDELQASSGLGKITVAGNVFLRCLPHSTQWHQVHLKKTFVDELGTD